MSDWADDFKALKDHNKRLRAKFGVPCPECRRLLPQAHPKILLPQGYCKMHRYRDPRPELTNEQFSSV